MSINLPKTLVSSVVPPEIARPTQRKPPQRAHSVDVPQNQAPKLSDSPIPRLSQNDAEKLLIPATWTEVIENPRVWAEIRPLIVDED